MVKHVATITAAEYRGRQTEAQFQAAVIEAARLHGWLVFWWPNAVINPIWPDLTLIKDSRVVFAELKTERGKLGKKQLERLQELASAGMDVRVWRPSGWDAFILPTLKGEQ